MDRVRRHAAIGGLLGALLLAAAARAGAAPLGVAAATPALGSLAEAVGGPDVRVTVLARPGEDPHAVDARPELVAAAASADLLLVNGLDLDAGWLPAVLERSGNPRVQPGAPGYLVGAAAIGPLQVPAQAAPGARRGAEHAMGNPHYLLDPMNGLRVAALIRDRLGELRPERLDGFRQRYDAFRARLGASLVGEELAARYGEFETLVGLAEHGRLARFLESQHLGEHEAPLRLGGWLGAMEPHRGARVAVDHDRWAYFAQRFGLEIVGALEPRPGTPPTPEHLGRLAALMRAQRARLILAGGESRDARWLAERSGARIVVLAGEPAAARGYLEMIDDDVRRVAAALAVGATSTTTSSTTPPPG